MVRKLRYSWMIGFVLIVTSLGFSSMHPAITEAASVAAPARGRSPLGAAEWHALRPLSASSSLRPMVSTAAAHIVRVPEDSATLTGAIALVEDGGVIDVAGGTYGAPSGGFLLNDLGKAFTVRARAGATVILDGGGTRPVLKFMNSSPSAGKPISFIGLTFSNGKSTSGGISGGVTMNRSVGTFIDCTFVDNVATSSAISGGGAVVTLGSSAYFWGTSWSGNSAKKDGGALEIAQGSTVFVHDSEFTNNRTNLPNHDPNAAGGAIHAVDSDLSVSNSRFDANQAGYVGGAIYALGTWSAPTSTAHANVFIANSTFIDNQAARDASVSSSLPTEGGAFHVEDQATAIISHSRFITNSADLGGGANEYRAILTIRHSSFLGNMALGATTANGFGGAIAATSNDISSDLSNNHRSAELTLEDTYIQGRYASVTTTAQVGGGIYVAGDGNRMYGLNGVSKSGTLAENRAQVSLSHVILADLDVAHNGGGVMTDLAALTAADCSVVESDAQDASGGSGGGMAILNQSTASLQRVAFGKNSAGQYGGGLFVQGSELQLSDSLMVGNEVSPGTTEAESVSYGASIFTTVDEGRDLPATGVVSGNSLFDSVGLPVFDDDRDNASKPQAINAIRYDGNTFYPAYGSGNYVYRDSLTGFATASGLNALVVNRPNTGTSTDKSLVDNAVAPSAPEIGNLQAAPQAILQQNAPGDPAPPTLSYLAYVWSGSSASLDSSPLGQSAGTISTTLTGTHSLSVGSGEWTAGVSSGPSPTADFHATWNGGADWTLAWSTTSGTFLNNGIDGGVSITSSASGSTSVTAGGLACYRLFELVEEGGTVQEACPTFLFTPLISKP